MTLAQQIKRRTDLATFHARQGKARTAKMHLARADQLTLARQIKRECSKTYRMFDDAVNPDDFENSREVYGAA